MFKRFSYATKRYFNYNIGELEANIKSPPRRRTACLEVGVGGCQRPGFMARWGWRGRAAVPGGQVAPRLPMCLAMVLPTGPAPSQGARAAPWPLALEGGPVPARQDATLAWPDQVTASYVQCLSPELISDGKKECSTTHEHPLIRPPCSQDTVTGTNHSKSVFLGHPRPPWPVMGQTLRPSGVQRAQQRAGRSCLGDVAGTGRPWRGGRAGLCLCPAGASGMGVSSPGSAGAAIPRGSQPLPCPVSSGALRGGAVLGHGAGGTGTGRGAGDPGPYIKGLWQSCCCRGKTTALH